MMVLYIQGEHHSAFNNISHYKKIPSSAFSLTPGMISSPLTITFSGTYCFTFINAS